MNNSSTRFSGFKVFDVSYIALMMSANRVQGCHDCTEFRLKEASELEIGILEVLREEVNSLYGSTVRLRVDDGSVENRRRKSVRL